MKAFIVNRVGDFGFALGIFMVFWLTGSVTYEAVFAKAGAMSKLSIHFIGFDWNAMTIACLLLFMGAMGKSAQFLLHTWLPDAMEGPTPVSALIHAATMVTAGVFMVARLSPLFELSQVALTVVMIVGATTAFFAATIGLAQNDIKRVIAYSTCSQLGYMFCGAWRGGVWRRYCSISSRTLSSRRCCSWARALSSTRCIMSKTSGYMGGLFKKIPFTGAIDGDRHTSHYRASR